MSQTTLGRPREDTYRTIVKDAYSTRDGGESRLEIVVWQVDQDRWIPGSEGREGVEDPIKTASGNLRYDKILNDAMDELGSDEIARRTGLDSYADDRGGRAASTIRGYKQKDDWAKPKDEGGFESSHPVKRVLRRYARSRDLGHFEEDEAGDERIALPPRSGRMISGEIDLGAMKRAYKLARSIASQNGFVFVDRSGDGEAVEDNERIDEDEIRRQDRPTGEVHAGCLLIKPGGKAYEYEIDLDTGDLERVNVGKNFRPELPPTGY